QGVTDQARMCRNRIANGGFCGAGGIGIACGHGAAMSSVSLHRTGPISMVSVRSAGWWYTLSAALNSRRFQPVRCRDWHRFSSLPDPSRKNQRKTDELVNFVLRHMNLEA